MRAALVLIAACLAACAGARSSSAPSAPKPGSTIVRGTERIMKDGTFELSAPGCPPGIHRLVFGKNAAKLLKFTIRGPVTDIGTIEGDK